MQHLCSKLGSVVESLLSLIVDKTSLVPEWDKDPLVLLDSVAI